jgi:hypothetical protein
MYSGYGQENLRVEERWYYQTDERLLAQRLLATADAVDHETQERQIGILDRFCLYGDRAAIPSSIPLTLAGSGEIKRRNPVPNACDTLVAELSKDPVAPMFVTANGSYDQRRTAEKLTAAWGWVSDRQGVLAKSRRAALDAIVAGCGWLRAVEETDGSVSLERVYPGDVLIDDRACVDEMPRELYLRRWVDRGVLWELYPDARQMIEDAGNNQDRYVWALNNPHSPTADVIELIEAWRLPSFQPFERDGQSYEAGDGHWALAIRCGGEERAGLLDHCAWDRPTFPLVGLRALAPSRGYWGLPLIDRPAASGLDLNKLYQRIAEALHHVAVPRVWVRDTAGQIVPKIQNTIGAVIRYTGNNPVQFQTPEAMTPEVYRHTERLEQNVYKDAGVSQMSATSTKEAGLQSGRAIRIARETQTLRWVTFADDYAGAMCTLALRWAEAEAAAAEDYPDRKTAYRGPEGYQDEIRWERVSDDVSIMVTTPKPTSGLGNTPAARMQDIQDNVTAGVFTPEDGLRLHNDPDLESIKEERLGAENRIRKVLGGMLDGGPYVGPDPEMPLERAAQLALAKIHAATVQGCPAKRIDNVRRFKNEAFAKLQAATPPPPPAPMPGPEMMPEGAIPALPGAGPALPGAGPGMPMPELGGAPPLPGAGLPTEPM